MPLSITSLVRTQRRLWALTQKELARLLGISHRTQVSKLERGKRAPTIKVAVSSSIIFGIDVKVLFPKLWRDIEREVLTRIRSLHTRVSAGTTYKSKRKAELTQMVITNITRTHRTTSKHGSRTK